MNTLQLALSRTPFTIASLAILVGAGIYGRSHVGLLDETVHANSTYSIRLALEGQMHRVFTSLLFTAGGWRFYSSIVMFAVAVGWVEYNRGTILAAAAFFGIHVLTLAVMTIAVFLWNQVSDTQRGNLLWHVQDVGPSAGYYGCLGLAVVSLAPQLRLPILVAIVVLLVVRAAWSFVQLPDDGRMLSADLAHLIAFPLGISTAWMLPPSC